MPMWVEESEIGDTRTWTCSRRESRLQFFGFQLTVNLSLFHFMPWERATFDGDEWERGYYSIAAVVSFKYATIPLSEPGKRMATAPLVSTW